MKHVAEFIACSTVWGYRVCAHDDTAVNLLYMLKYTSNSVVWVTRRCVLLW